jgi:catechol 2,3-dioxygenase-like lactoylglutathione lyase family enzyme
VRILSTHHLALTTGSFERLRAFYVETLGLPVVGGFPDHEIVFLGAGSTTIELIGENSLCAKKRRSAENRAQRQGWHHLAWEVEDVDAAFAELPARGVEAHSPPEDFPPGEPQPGTTRLRIAFLRDPDGNLLELVAPLNGREGHASHGHPG